MFWILKKSRLTHGAVSFFNSINNNVSSQNGAGVGGGAGGGGGGSGVAGYNKLCCVDEDSKTDNRNDNDKKESIFDYVCAASEFGSDSSSCSELDIEDDLSQDSDNDENLTCNVCDRYFYSSNQLSQHQQKKRHFGCSFCDSLFSSLMALEHHKEEFEHWTRLDARTRNLSDQDSDQDQSFHEMERLLL